MALPVIRCICRYSAFSPKRGNLQRMGYIYVQSVRHLIVYEKDPAPLFFNPDVQQLLKKMTRGDIKKIFRRKKESEKLVTPEYKFMTTEELNKCLKEAEKKAEQKLQIPPVVKEREEINEVLSEDSAVTDHDSDGAKLVFTDITYGLSDRDRLIVVREPNGILRKAFWEERFRVNQIYFPSPERQMRIPHMFEKEYLMDLLDKGEYEFILDRACVQFEPDDPEYFRVTSTTYEHIENEHMYDSLLSTRHYGAMVFYLAWNKQIDGLVLHNIQSDRLEDAVLLIKLLHILHHDCKSAAVKHEEALPFIRAYIGMDSTRKSVLELALESHLELKKQQEIVSEGVKRAHGL